MYCNKQYCNEGGFSVHSIGIGTPEAFSFFSIFEVLMLGNIFSCYLLSTFFFQSPVFLLMQFATCPGQDWYVSLCMCPSVNLTFTAKHKSSLGQS